MTADKSLQTNFYCPGKWMENWLNLADDNHFSGTINLMVGTCEENNCTGTLKTSSDSKELELTAFYRHVFNEKVATNFQIVTGNGAMISCHRNILEGIFTEPGSFTLAKNNDFKRFSAFSVHSKAFATMLKEGQFQEGNTDSLKLDDMTEGAIHALLKFLYYRDIKGPTQNLPIAIELLTCAHKHDINSLEESMWSILMTQPRPWFAINTALRIFSSDSQSDFKKRATEILRL